MKSLFVKTMVVAVLFGSLSAHAGLSTRIFEFNYDCVCSNESGDVVAEVKVTAEVWEIFNISKIQGPLTAGFKANRKCQMVAPGTGASCTKTDVETLVYDPNVSKLK